MDHTDAGTAGTPADEVRGMLALLEKRRAEAVARWVKPIDEQIDATRRVLRMMEGRDSRFTGAARAGHGRIVGAVLRAVDATAGEFRPQDVHERVVAMEGLEGTDLAAVRKALARLCVEGRLGMIVRGKGRRQSVYCKV